MQPRGSNLIIKPSHTLTEVVKLWSKFNIKLRSFIALRFNNIIIVLVRFFSKNSAFVR